MIKGKGRKPTAVDSEPDPYRLLMAEVVDELEQRCAANGIHYPRWRIENIAEEQTLTYIRKMIENRFDNSREEQISDPDTQDERLDFDKENERTGVYDYDNVLREVAISEVSQEIYRNQRGWLVTEIFKKIVRKDQILKKASKGMEVNGDNSLCIISQKYYADGRVLMKTEVPRQYEGGIIISFRTPGTMRLEPRFDYVKFVENLIANGIPPEDAATIAKNTILIEDEAYFYPKE